MQRKTFIIKEEEGMQEIVTQVLTRTPQGDGATILALVGDLGTGKTTFTKTLAKALGIEEHITSPTFIIQKSYTIPTLQYPYKTLVHIDAYRLKSGADTKVINLQETVKDPTNIVVVEWADLIKESLPKNAVTIGFVYKDGTTREVTIDGTIGDNDK